MLDIYPIKWIPRDKSNMIEFESIKVNFFRSIIDHEFLGQLNTLQKIALMIDSFNNKIFYHNELTFESLLNHH